MRRRIQKARMPVCPKTSHKTATGNSRHHQPSAFCLRTHAKILSVLPERTLHH